MIWLLRAFVAASVVVGWCIAVLVFFYVREKIRHGFWRINVRQN